MQNNNSKIRQAINEPIKEYKPNSNERAQLKSKLHELENDVHEIPIIIG